MTEDIEHVEAVVVGSGFGGAVSAYRLAEAGVPVVVLERGRGYAPGDFPRTPAELGRAFWDPSAGLYGLFDVWSFSGCDSIVSSGLGGGSLIYANVLLRKDEKWFVHEEPLPNREGYENWPVTRADLDPHYDAVERMLGGTPYPLERPAYRGTAKAHALQDAAAQLGLDWWLPPLAVSFAPDADTEPGLGLPIADPHYGNLHGPNRRHTCRLCGECDIGCNEGAKNSLDHTYLSAAAFHGAELRTGHEVRAIRPRENGGYEVDYVRHDPAREGTPADTKALPVTTMSCDRLILAAGTYGTSYLLLRNRDRFKGLSQALGTRFSGNGDLLTFLLRATDRRGLRTLNSSRGPVITTAVRLPDDVDGGSGRGAYIEDGGYPGFVDWLVEGADLPRDVKGMLKAVFERLRAFWSHDPHISREMSDLLGKGALSVSSLPLLGMGRDVPDGMLRLNGEHLEVDMTTATSEAYFDRVRTTMRRIADVLGAEYADLPGWFRNRIITVHPVGGAPMGEHPGVGVCDPYGEVYGFPGLYIADGAAMPGAVGPNPSLTIAALADRMCERLLDRRGGAPIGVPIGAAGPIQGGSAGGAGGGTACVPADHRGVTAAGRTSLSFTEEMKGYYASGVSGPRAGDVAGRRLGQRFGFRLTITIDDVNRFLTEPEHTARAEGWIDAAACGGRRRVQRGWFNLFAAADRDDRRLMRYRLHFTDDAGQPRTLTGWKNIVHGPLTDIWPDTSTLFFRVLEGHVIEGGDEGAAIVGAGTLHIQVADFARQLTTFRAHGPHGLHALERFGAFFAGRLWDVYRPKELPPAESAESA